MRRTWLVGVLKSGSSLVPAQESFLAELFNCAVKRRRSEALSIADAPPEAPDFVATDSDLEGSDAASGMFFESEAEDQFLASDDAAPPRQEQKRSYPERRKESLVFLNCQVCVQAGARLLGIGQSTLQKVRKGHSVYNKADRAPIPRHPTFGFSLRGDVRERWQGVVMYLWHVYHSSAECLPTDFRHSLGKPKGQLDEAPFGGRKDADELARHINGFMRALETYGTDVEVHMIGPGTFRGERRHLQHSNRSEMYFEYLAHCQSIGEQPASYGTFLRVANKVVSPQLRSGHLHFRKGSEHAKCDTCIRLKANLKFKSGRAQEKAAREETIRAYSHHILSQWMDRQCYWSFRSMSQSWFRQLELGERTGFKRLAQMSFDSWFWTLTHSNVLRGFAMTCAARMYTGSLATSLACVIQDGMDQSKFKCPRLRSKETSKLLSKLYRPRLHVAASWVHGRAIYFVAISGEEMPKDATAEIEQLARSLDNVLSDCGSLPVGLSCQADNTYREAKNRHYIGFLMLMTVLKTFRFVLANFLRVGHSHEDLDQVFSVQASLISRCEFDTPSDLIDILDSAARPDSDAERLRRQHRAQKVDVVAYLLDECADWQRWVSMLGVRVKGLRPSSSKPASIIM